MRCKNAFVNTAGHYISQPHYIKLLLALLLQSKFQFVYFPPVIPTKLSCFIKSVYISVHNWGCPPSFNRLKFCSHCPCQLWPVSADEKMKSKPCLWLSVPSRAGFPLSPALFQPSLWRCLCHPSCGVFLVQVQTQIFPFFMNTKPLPCPFLTCFFLSLKICHSSNVSTAIQLSYPPLCIS